MEAFDDCDRRCAGAVSFGAGGLVCVRMIASEGLFLAVEFNDHMALVFGSLNGGSVPSAHQKTCVKLGKSRPAPAPDSRRSVPGP